MRPDRDQPSVVEVPGAANGLDGRDGFAGLLADREGLLGEATVIVGDSVLLVTP